MENTDNWFDAKINKMYGGYPFKPEFTAAHNFLMDNLEALNLKGEHFSLFMFMWRCHNKQTGDCFPSVGLLAKRLQWSKSTVEKRIKEMRDLGYITVTKRHNGSLHESNAYSFEGLFEAMYRVFSNPPAEKQAEKAVAAPPVVQAKPAPVQVAPVVVVAPEPVQAVPAQMENPDYIPTVAELIQMAAAKDVVVARPEVKAEVKTPVSAVKAVEAGPDSGDDFQSMVRKGQAEELAQEFTISGAPSYVQKLVLAVFGQGRLTQAQARTFIREGVAKLRESSLVGVGGIEERTWWGDYCRSMAA